MNRPLSFAGFWRVFVFFTALACTLFATGCAGPGLAPKSHAQNPLGWPAKGFATVGRAGAVSEVPLVRESGRLLYAVGELLESPALLVEGVVTARPEYFPGAFAQLVAGTGGTITAAGDLPLFIATTRYVDLAPFAPAVNDALAYLDASPSAVARIFPPGTRVRAAGKNLLWEIPGEGAVLQSAEDSPLFRFGCWIVGENYSAQERSYGFIVPQAAPWTRVSRDRVDAILHEFYHQHRQIHGAFHGWAALYWIGYYGAFPFQGYRAHWAETAEKDGAYRVEQALRRWKMPAPQPTPPPPPTQPG